MIMKVYDFLRSLGWYLTEFIYDLIDSVLKVIKELNAFDIISSLADNKVFQSFYTGIFAIAITLFALFIVWKFLNKVLDPDDEITIKQIVMEIFKCGMMIMLSTFLFVQVSDFSIKLAGYTGNIFESNTNMKMSSSMLSMYISYTPEFKEKYPEQQSEFPPIDELVDDGTFANEQLYNEKFVTKHKLFGDDKDYIFSINWIMAILCGGFFLYSLFFAGIMLGRRQIEFLFLFTISPIVFATSICNKQRRGAVIEQLVSLVLQSAVIMLIVSLTVMIMQQINLTTFFPNSTFQDILIKSLLYIGCATFILTGSQTINRFIGANVSAASGREQLMSLMGFGKMAGVGALGGTAAAIGGGLLATSAVAKGGGFAKNAALTKAGQALGTFGATIPDASGNTPTPTRTQRFASALGNRMYVAGQQGFERAANKKESSPSSAIFNAGMSSLSGAVRTVAPRASYNASLYRRRNRV